MIVNYGFVLSSNTNGALSLSLSLSLSGGLLDK